MLKKEPEKYINEINVLYPVQKPGALSLIIGKPLIHRTFPQLLAEPIVGVIPNTNNNINSKQAKIKHKNKRKK